MAGSRGRGVRGVLRGGRLRASAARAGDAAIERYRTAVDEQSRALPVYLRAADVAGVALRARRAVAARPGGATIAPLPEPAVPAVSSAAISEAGELSFVLTGVHPWRRTIAGLALREGEAVHPLGDVLLGEAGDAIRVLAPLPAGIAEPELVLVDADGEPLDLPVPSLPGLLTGRTAAGA